MKELICIVCPNSCRLTVDDNMEVSGYKCKRGIDFAIAETRCPTRSITSTVKSSIEGYPVISVKTNGEVPKKDIFDIMSIINKTTVTKDVVVGSIIVANINGSGVDLVSTTNTTRRTL